MINRMLPPVLGMAREEAPTKDFNMKYKHALFASTMLLYSVIGCGSGYILGWLYAIPFAAGAVVVGLLILTTGD